MMPLVVSLSHYICNTLCKTNAVRKYVDLHLITVIKRHSSVSITNVNESINGTNVRLKSDDDDNLNCNSHTFDPLNANQSDVNELGYEIKKENCDNKKSHANVRVANNQHEYSNKIPIFNEIGIQMISSALNKRIFGEKRNNFTDETKINEINDHLNAHKLKQNTGKKKQKMVVSPLPYPNIDEFLPKLCGDNLDEHFHNLGNKFSKVYKQLSFEIINNELPPMPLEWCFREGWTRYTYNCDATIVAESVDHPLEHVLVFDVEVCMNDRNGNAPTMATAVSPKAWYSWCSKRLINCNTETPFNFGSFDSSQSNINDLIPLGNSFEKEKLIIGHNVSFDRTYIKEQYGIDADKTRFMDTLSLHMCISGLTQHQRALSLSKKSQEKSEENEENESYYDLKRDLSPDLWTGVSSLNNLVDVYELYCNDKQKISKELRDIFVNGNIKEVFDNFNVLMTYCANDVIATYKIFKNIFPIFNERFPHPVTLAGMLELSIMYLPVNVNNWNRYITEAQSLYDAKERELNLSLREIANDACSLLVNKQYKKDVWLWDLNWDTPMMRFKKPKTVPVKKKKTDEISDEQSYDYSDTIKETSLLTKDVIGILSSSLQLKKIQPLRPGYPRWYTEFCEKIPVDIDVDPDSKEWESGPYLISTQMRSVPKLMRLLWNGFPLHYDEKHGWGYLKPDETFTEDLDEVPGGIDQNKNVIYFPLKQFKRIVNERQYWKDVTIEASKLSDHISLNNYDYESPDTEHTAPVKDVIEGCLFYKLPHKGGPTKRVGNPLSKDFLKKVEDNTLTAYKSDITNLVLRQSKILSYWKNACKRIHSQMVLTSNDDINGAILPRVIVAGTVTRRAVEPTWLTASNAYEDRLGSELKGIIQCPDGYNFVGADVDSQELWIASLIGDAHFAGIHGCTGIGWMTLQGDKSSGTDMHSKTASSINISRDHSKILNYARIYGSGQSFATRFLMQSNPGLSAKEAKEKAKKIFTETKGNRKKLFTNKKEKKDKNVDQSDVNEKRQWYGGTESHMFNKLEEIADSPDPRTPVLGCRISRALEPRVVKDNYITSRINWVVQSSAVDFLHLMLVIMKWQMEDKKINGRFAISIHDEVRYLIKSEDRYEAAMALQIANLLTRAFFSYKLGMNDLPQSVAFFSSVDIDKCIRKEVIMDCKTPSNPLGLRLGYGVPFGESYDVFQLLKKLRNDNQ